MNVTGRDCSTDTVVVLFFCLLRGSFCGIMSDDEMDVSDGEFVSGSEEAVSDDDWKEEKPVLVESKSFCVMAKTDVIQQVQPAKFPLFFFCVCVCVCVCVCFFFFVFFFFFFFCSF